MKIETGVCILCAIQVITLYISIHCCNISVNVYVQETRKTQQRDDEKNIKTYLHVNGFQVNVAKQFNVCHNHNTGICTYGRYLKINQRLYGDRECDNDIISDSRHA